MRQGKKIFCQEEEHICVNDDIINHNNIGSLSNVNSTKVH